MTPSSRAVVAASLQNLASGGLYAYSVLLPAFETGSGIGRADASLIFSLATVAFLAGVWVAARIGRRASARGLCTTGSAAMIVGLAWCAWAPSYVNLLIGYSVVYGVGVGVGYAGALAMVAQAPLERRGWASGIVVAAFALGSVAWARAYAASIVGLGLAATLVLAALAIVVLGALAWAIAGPPRRTEVAAAKATFSTSADVGAPVRPWARSSLVTLWLAFFAGASGGLAVISQATALAGATAPGDAAGTWAAMAVGLGNGAGRLAGGASADHCAPHRLLAAIALTMAVALGALAIGSGAAPAWLWLALIAIGYGALSAAVPAVLMHALPVQAFAGSYARTFTAWGCAGLLAPWAFGGWFAASGRYTEALVLLAVLNAAIALGLLARRRL
ncbi:MAG: MFS transporter [Casimicrobiaceae bacterium]